jgi:segregation and condensation protein B
MEMTMAQMEAAIEAVLFTMGDSVETSKLALAIGQDTDTTRKIVRNLSDKYKSEDRGIKIIELEDSFQMCTKPECYEALVKVATAPKKHILTDAVLETLSIIAYKQPVTRIELEQIRGVKCDYSVNKLIEYNLVMEVGRLDAPGKPILFGTTEEFLRTFGLSSVEDLPVISADKIADFKIEAEEESQLTLDI